MNETPMLQPEQRTKGKPGRPRTLTMPWKPYSMGCYDHQIRAIDRLARMRRSNRSALMREALDLFLAANLHILQMDETTNGENAA